MASNIKVQRVCQLCGNEFTARTTVTQYCSDTCAKRAYKARKRGEKIEKSHTETKALKEKPITDIKAKDFLTVPDVATLLNCSLRTAYRLVKQGTIKGVNLAQRKTLIRRVDIDKLFELSAAPKSESQPTEYEIADCYTITEIQSKFKVSEKTLYDAIKRNGIPKQKQGRFTYVPKPLIDKLLA